ncbi:DUF4190 domain-containing protein [Bacillus piscicola]|uniref:DUF4190 domain-containing protein n=1 Tax=Bacillus piscicola TaxID=1632684 RepID=UPI001F08B6A6|nr:DUF4190 domain-containing protein [Bacillus piscicola]
MDENHTYNENNPAQPVTTNGKAITSLVLGILSVVCIFLIFFLSPLFGIVGLIFGIMAMKEVKRTGQSGRGMAIAGIVCSSTGIMLSLFLIILFVIGFALFMDAGNM